MSKPIIYCDMDGVLADFKTGAQRTTGMSINKWMNIPSSREKWSLIKAKKDFWSTLPWMPGGRQLWSYISKFDPHILSAYVEESYDPNCIPGKTKWLNKNAGIAIRNSTTVSQAATIFDAQYERSSGAHRQKRIDNAEALYIDWVSTSGGAG